MSAEDDLKREMKKLADMGVTISIKRAPGAAFRPHSPTDEIARAAREEGILEGDHADR